MTGKLFSSTIAAKPKRVRLSSSFQVNAIAAIKPVVLEATYRIGADIEKGVSLPESVYRTNRFGTPDNLLSQTGIMHLHPLGLGTSELLFLVQYDASVLFLEISDHSHFRILPPGHLLLTVHQNAVDDHELNELRREKARQQVFGADRSGS